MAYDELPEGSKTAKLQDLILSTVDLFGPRRRCEAINHSILFTSFIMLGLDAYGSSDEEDEPSKDTTVKVRYC